MAVKTRQIIKERTKIAKALNISLNIFVKDQKIKYNKKSDTVRGLWLRLGWPQATERAAEEEEVQQRKRSWPPPPDR